MHAPQVKTSMAQCDRFHDQLQPKENPAEAGFAVQIEKILLVAGANHFDFNATVLGTTGIGLVVSDGLSSALAFGVHASTVNALGVRYDFTASARLTDSFWFRSDEPRESV